MLQLCQHLKIQGVDIIGPTERTFTGKDSTSREAFDKHYNEMTQDVDRNQYLRIRTQKELRSKAMKNGNDYPQQTSIIHES